MTREIELKFLLDAATEARLRAADPLRHAECQRLSDQTLHAIYLDTDARALAALGVALRLRKEGRRWVQAVKAGTGVVAGLSSPRESECAAPGGRLDLAAIPDADLRALVTQTVGDTPLAPVCETVIRRSRRILKGPHGGSVELAIDVGEIRAGGRAEPIREAELELKSGDPRDLYAVARALFTEGPLRFSRRTKAARGHALAQGRPAVEAVPAPILAAPVALKPSQTTESAAASVLRGCLDQIAGNAAAAALGDAPEGPHQLRVGLRRLRTAVAVFGPVIDCPALAALAAEAQALAATVGAVRDLDVLAQELVAPMASADPGFKPLAAALESRAKTARAAARARLAAPQTVALILDLGAFVEARGWLRPADFDQTAELAQPVIRTAQKALDRRWRKAAHLGAQIDSLEGEARHDLRKALKKLRYAIEFFESLWPKRKVRPFLTRLKTLQDDFGAMQDVLTAETLLLGPDAPAARDPAAQRAVGRLLGAGEAESARRWARARDDWAALAQAKHFWA
ncbi:MAG: CHAD domain-containing protein [Rhodobacterales bacterium]|nr:CHAD domain-containing protein [Rhodobacterales bacterium]